MMGGEWADVREGAPEPIPAVILLASEAEAQGMGWRKAMHTPKEQEKVESWAAVAAADLGKGVVTLISGDKRVVKQAEDLLLLDLLGWGVFGRRRD